MTTDINDLTLAQRNLVKTATGRLKDEFAGIFAAETPSSAWPEAWEDQTGLPIRM